MAKFKIEPHFRLQEWVAEEKGYFRDEGLDYEFKEFIRSTGGAHHVTSGQSGAFQSIEKGRESNITCACHWTVNVAASRGHTKLFADAYSVAPSGIFVHAGSAITTPADLAGVPISVGFQSGSHYATIQALEGYLAPGEIKLSFDEGMLFSRMEAFFDGKSQAATLFSGPYYFAEQLGYRKIIDTTFMIGAMVNGDPIWKTSNAISARCAGRSGISTCGRICIPTTTRPSFPSASMRGWIRGAGGRANGSCSSPTPAKCSRNPSTGLPGTKSSRPEAWAPATTTSRSYRSASRKALCDGDLADAITGLPRYLP